MTGDPQLPEGRDLNLKTSLAAPCKMRIDNRMILNEGACQCVVRELTDLVKGEGKHAG